jgi:hypothetical protein
MPKFLGTSLLRALAICSLLAVGAAQTQTEERRQIFLKIESSLKALKDITGLDARKRIDYDLITRDKVNQFLKDQIRDSIKPEELRAEEITLKKLGFAPPDFNLEKSTVDLMTEQAAAFYDYHKKKLFLTDWAPSAMEQPALVHELAHALADQNFHLQKFISSAGPSDDSSLARMAVMEGQATWLMTEVQARSLGQSLLSSPGLLEAASSLAEAGTSQFPVFNSVPLYLRETLVFPYTEGAKFQDALIRKLGTAGFAEVFRRPPTSSQHILHPEKYFDHVEPTLPPLPSVSLGKGYKPSDRGHARRARSRHSHPAVWNSRASRDDRPALERRPVLAGRKSSGTARGSAICLRVGFSGTSRRFLSDIQVGVAEKVDEDGNLRRKGGLCIRLRRRRLLRNQSNGKHRVECRRSGLARPCQTPIGAID